MSPESPHDATGIARRQFSTVRKGYDPQEVRAFLHEVSELVGRLQRSEAHERERAERAEERATRAEQLDEHRLVEILGEETARVLDAARAAAADIRAKAEESAARMVREAQAEARAIVEQAEAEATAKRAEILAEADALRREAEAEVERQRAEGQEIVDEMRRTAEQERDRMISEGELARAEAEAAAEQIRAAAREQGRRLVGEAQAVRERVLADLARRRRIAREQLERLNGARERLLAAYQVVRRTVDEATHELTIALPEARAASEEARRRVHEEPEESVEVIEAELSVARMSGQAADVAGATVPDEEFDAMLRELAEEEAAQAAASRSRTTPGDGAGEDGPADGEQDAGGEHGEARDRAGAEAGGGSDAGGAAAGGAEAPGGAAPAGDRAAEAGAGRPAAPAAPSGPAAMTDAEKWGIRLPRPRSAGRRPPVAPAPTTPTPEPAGSPAAPSPTGSAAGDDGGAGEGGAGEGRAGRSVDELFARLRGERSAREAEAAAAAPEAPGDAAVAVAVRDEDAEAPGDDAVDEVPPTAAPEADRAGTPAAGVDAVAAVDDEAAEPDGEDEPVDPAARLLGARDTVLAAVERDLNRHLKRVLADEQNEVLDQLRRGGAVEFDDVLPAADVHADRYAEAASPHLVAAAAKGAALVGGTAPGIDALAAEMGHVLVDQLRHRIAATFEECDGDLDEVTERLRSLYREWKGNQIGEAVRHYAVAAHGLGVVEAAPPGTRLRWLVDPSCEHCPDCDDNRLAGEVARGSAFPTGDRGAPAHRGCRCLAVPAELVEAG
ncbi:MAG TPA: ATP synthase F0 subunit B [Acidimicrobiales bacterium]|nr:ATP synthase F0 subunit B [Acidimicrobiales bacterium]